MENGALSLLDVLTVEAEHFFLFILWAMCSVFGVLKRIFLVSWQILKPSSGKFSHHKV